MNSNKNANKVYIATCEKTFSNLHLAGQYKKTEIDIRKENANFRLIGITGKYHTIIWKDGRTETIVGKKAFDKMTKIYDWVTDF